jgi:hypothetical protein
LTAPCLYDRILGETPRLACCTRRSNGDGGGR